MEEVAVAMRLKGDIIFPPKKILLLEESTILMAIVGKYKTHLGTCKEFLLINGDN